MSYVNCSFYAIYISKRKNELTKFKLYKDEENIYHLNFYITL